MNEPTQPAEPGTDHGVGAATETGAPKPADTEAEPKATPNSDRAKTENAVNP